LSSLRGKCTVSSLGREQVTETERPGILLERLGCRTRHLRPSSEGELDPITEVGAPSAVSDRYVFADGPLAGTTGYFERGDDNRVHALHLFGRWLPRIAT